MKTEIKKRLELKEADLELRTHFHLGKAASREVAHGSHSALGSSKAASKHDSFLGAARARAVPQGLKTVGRARCC